MILEVPPMVIKNVPVLKRNLDLGVIVKLN